MAEHNPTKAAPYQPRIDPLAIRITEVACVRCGHRVIEHMAEGEHPDLPGKMPCEVAGCECVDFHFCHSDDCKEGCRG